MDPSDNPNQTILPDESRHERFKYRRWVLVPVLFCYVFSGVMSGYTVTEYIRHTINTRSHPANKTGSNSSCFTDGHQKDINDHVQRESTRWNIYLTLALYVPAIFSNIALGSYTDLIGRKVLIVINLSGIMVRITFIVLITKLKMDLFYFIFANLIEGITGSYTMLLAVSFAYISDLTKAGNQRTFFIVLLELVLALAETASAITVGYFIHFIGFFYAAIAAALISFLAVIMAAVALPETLMRNRISIGNEDPPKGTSCSRFLQSAKNIWTLYFGQNDKRTSAKHVVLLMAFTFTCFSQFGTLDALYQLGSPFCWSATQIGWYAALKTGISSLVGMLGAYLLKKGVSDEGIVTIGTTSYAISLVVEAMAKTSTVLYLVPVLGLLSSLPVPMLRSLMSHMTSSDKQGTLYASIGAVETLCILFGALTTNAVYAATLKIMNGFVFLVAAMYALVALVLIMSFMVMKRCGPDDSFVPLQDNIGSVNDDMPAN